MVLNEHKLLVKNEEKKVREEERNIVALMLELKRSNRGAKRIECENKLLRQSAAVLFDSAVRKAALSSTYMKRPLEALESQFVVLPMSVTHTYGARCGREAPELKRFFSETM